MVTCSLATDEREVAIGAWRLPGILALPAECRGIIVFAHGSGSSRLSPRNAHVAERLQQAGFATLLFDLLTTEEASHRARVFDIPLLASRVGDALRWLDDDQDCAALPVGLFGASTGGAAALVAAAQMPKAVAAVVSRGGRPDLAGDALGAVEAPTLLVVGGDDLSVLALNRAALDRLSCVKRLVVVPNASHLFEEPGTLDQVVDAAADWFAAYLARP